IHLNVRGDSGECDLTKRVLVNARQWMQWRDPLTGESNIPYLAGWVTPDAPAIHTLVGQTTHGGIGALVGYGDGTVPAQAVLAQVDALFDTLHSVRQVRYASDNVPFNTDAVQRIQLPSDVLGSKFPIGMCVETTVILASAV